jgi:hypothetical protein
MNSMKEILRTSSGPSFQFDWASINDEDQRVIARSCISSYETEFKALQRKASKLIKDDMRAKALCVHNLKTHLAHGLFLDVCTQALNLNKDHASCLAYIGKQVHEGRLQDDILELIKRMEPRAARKLLQADAATKSRYVAMFEETGTVPSQRTLKAESSDVRKVSSSEPSEAQKESTRIQMELMAMPTVDVFEPAPTTTDLPAALPTADRVQQGIDMLIESLHLIGSIDELAIKPQYLDQLKPHFMTLEVLSGVCAPTTPVRWRR